LAAAAIARDPAIRIATRIFRMSLLLIKIKSVISD